MNDFTFDKEAWAEYVSWQTEDRKTLKKINNLIEDIQRNGAMKGIGKPEPLKHRKGYSRRIDEANRLVYDIDELQNIRIISCKGHYED
ncbi:MAG: Txe/YoeB family addiction module toxin [Acetatifactor sp.]|nr:Txe/YoeB family addiction module toxin [Acetatifactor sp.]